MPFSLHWDGTNGKGLSSAPICIGLGNTNICDTSTQFCIAYMPVVPDENRKDFSKSVQVKVKHYIRQSCASTILKVMESAASKGVWCSLKNVRGHMVQRLCFPRLVSMNFDQPEAQLFFGMQNKTSCSRCKRRRGRSAFRRNSSRPTGAEVDLLYRLSENDNSDTARLKLKRWGFNWQRRCCVRTVCDKVLVRLRGEDEVYPCLDFRDTLHGLMIFIHRMLLETLDGLTVLKPALRNVMDTRLHAIEFRRCLRDPAGTLYRKPKTIFSEAGMTAVDRVCLIFLLPHVLGPTADIIPEARYRGPLLEAIAQAQLMIIAARGLRSYTVPELRIIYDQGYLRFFGALEQIKQLDFQDRVAIAARKNKPPPNPWRRKEPCVSRNACPSCYIAPSNSVTMHVIVAVTDAIFTLSHSSCDLYQSTLSQDACPRCYTVSFYSVTMHVIVAVTDDIFTLSQRFCNAVTEY